MSFNAFENNMLNQVAFILKKARNISPKIDMFKKKYKNYIYILVIIRQNIYLDPSDFIKDHNYIVSFCNSCSGTVYPRDSYIIYVIQQKSALSVFSKVNVCYLFDCRVPSVTRDQCCVMSSTSGSYILSLLFFNWALPFQ